MKSMQFSVKKKSTSVVFRSGLLFLAIFLSSIGAYAGKVKPPSPTPKPTYTYYGTGDLSGAVGGVAPRKNTTTGDYPSYVLMGGGPDVDEGFRWMIQKAGITKSTGGRLVVIRTTGDGGYGPYIFYSNRKSSVQSADIVDGWVGGASLGLTSVETLVIPSRDDANHATVNAIVANANALWIAGGDQSTYINFWKGTKLEATLNTLLKNKVPFGGTSAGLAVMGGFDYSALNASATSPLALANPYYPDITFDPSPLSTVGGFIAPDAFKNVIFDTHFDSRDRMGRLVTFVSRLVGTYNGTYGCSGGVLGNVQSSSDIGVLNNSNQARGIGIGVETALLIEGSFDGFIGKAVTNISTTTSSAVYFVDVTQGPTQCAGGKPLETPSSSVQVRKLAADVNATAATAKPVNLSTPLTTISPANFYTTGGAMYPAPAY